MGSFEILNVVIKGNTAKVRKRLSAMNQCYDSDTCKVMQAQLCGAKIRKKASAVKKGKCSKNCKALQVL